MKNYIKIAIALIITQTLFAGWWYLALLISDASMIGKAPIAGTISAAISIFILYFLKLLKTNPHADHTGNQ